MRVGIVGWRGMVGSVLMERMAAEDDLAHCEAGLLLDLAGRASRSGRREVAAVGLDRRTEEARLRPDHPGGRLHGGRLRQAAQRGLARLLDRRGLDAPHGGRQHHHPGPGQSRRHSRRAETGDQDLRGRKLHRQPDADGALRPVPREPGRVDQLDDLSGRLRRRREEHARADRADGGHHRQAPANTCSIRRWPFSISTATSRRPFAMRGSRWRISARRWRPA